MQVNLNNGTRQGIFHFDPSAQPWKKQASEFLPHFRTGLPGSLGFVFIKRTRVGEFAPGHDLMRQLVGQPFANTPQTLGIACEAGRVYYFFEDIPQGAGGFRLLQDIIEAALLVPSAQRQQACAALLQKETLVELILRASEMFTRLWQHGFVYVDFSAKNIFLRLHDHRVCFIDLDSSWPVSQLKHNRPGSQACELKLWGLWNEHVARAQPGMLERLPKTLVFSLAAVWLRALVLAAQGKLDSALLFVAEPGMNVQEPVWEALRKHDRLAFAKAFGLSSLPDDLYNRWQRLFDALIANRDVTWTDLGDAVKAFPTQPAVTTPCPVPGMNSAVHTGITVPCQSLLPLAERLQATGVGIAACAAIVFVCWLIKCFLVDLWAYVDRLRAPTLGDFLYNMVCLVVALVLTAAGVLAMLFVIPVLIQVVAYLMDAVQGKASAYEILKKNGPIIKK